MAFFWPVWCGWLPFLFSFGLAMNVTAIAEQANRSTSIPLALWDIVIDLSSVFNPILYMERNYCICVYNLCRNRTKLI